MRCTIYTAFFAKLLQINPPAYFPFVAQIMVMRLRFFKVVWHVIDLLIVVVGMLDIFVLHAVPVKETPDGGTVIGQKFIRVCFILSRLVRLLSLVEISPVRNGFFLPLVHHRE